MKITMKRRAAAWVVALAMLTGLTACGVSESTSELAGSASQSAAQTVDKDPFGKYEEPITLTAVRYLQDGIEFNEGEVWKTMSGRGNMPKLWVSIWSMPGRRPNQNTHKN